MADAEFHRFEVGVKKHKASKYAPPIENQWNKLKFKVKP